jgi:hypothetical protein
MDSTALREGVAALQTPVRQVTAVARFRGGPGREAEAAEAWAFEMVYYFTRAVGEPPRVEYADGVYTCTGLMQTTHPGDRSPVTVFDSKSEPWDLDFCADPARQERVRELYPRRGIWFDGRDHD